MERYQTRYLPAGKDSPYVQCHNATVLTRCADNPLLYTQPGSGEPPLTEFDILSFPQCFKHVRPVRIDTYVLEAIKETPKWVKGQLFYYKGSAHELGLWSEEDDPDCGVWIDPTNTIMILEPQAWESPYLQFKILN